MALSVAACTQTVEHRRLTALEAGAAVDDQRIDRLDTRIRAFERDLDDVVDLLGQAEADLAKATEDYQRAGNSARHAGRGFAQATRDYEAAARNWKLVTLALLTAASWDYAGHLCDTRMTTAGYRKELRDRGINLEGLDADHGLPRSRGGADHPLNYRMIESGLNRSLGNDVVQKLMTHPLHVLQGASVSALMRLRCSPNL